MYRGLVAVLLPLGVAACGRLGFDETTASVCTLTLDAGAARINFNTHRQLAAAGATSFVSSDSTLADVDDNGMLRSFDKAGQVTITAATDECTAEATLDVGGASFFYVGGSTMAVPTRDVLRSEDGATWTIVGQLPDRRLNGALVVFRDRLWWISGSDGSTPQTEIYASDDGVTWTEAGNVPTGATNFGFTVFHDQLWFVGGNNNAGRVYRSDDAINWTEVGSLPMDNHGGSLAPLGDRLIYAGGHNGSLFNWVLASPDGATWTQIGTLAVAREYHATTVIGDRLYIFGGQDTTPTSLKDVSSTTDGTNWTTEAQLPAGRAFGSIIRQGDRFWSLGGNDGGGLWTAQIGATWTSMPTTGFVIPRQAGAAALFTPPQ